MKLLFLLPLLVIGAVAKCQVEIIPSVDTSLYTGIDNPVTIKSAGIPLSELTFRTSSGVLSGHNGRYTIKCTNANTHALLEVLHKNTVVASKKININKISDPVAYAMSESVITTGTVTKKQLALIRSLVTKINCPLLKYTVTGFTVEMIHAGKTTGQLINNSKDLSRETTLFLNYAEAGDEVIFDSIQVVGPFDSRKRYVPAIKLKVI